MLIRIVAAALAVFAFAGSAFAQLLTERKVFTLPQYTTVGGKTIRNVRIGYESYGKLNAAGDNAIYIAHFLTANSHAAGRYKAEDKAAGYWDSVIGPGKPFDTDRYFVLSADTLVNVNSKDTGPGSVDPATGRPTAWLPDRHPARLRQRAEGARRLARCEEIAAVAPPMRSR
jgi:homoserine O-acetyltransferase